jgi:amino acid adenylation domain-containing protein/non-ribosomal peptide synthase protein (TIGR01720 family)/FkbM family methyltransferase
MSRQIIEGYQLSPQQKHLWSLYEGGEQTPYTAHGAIFIEGPLDREILRTALRQTIERQEILRTTFDLPSDMTMPLQIIEESGEFAIDECDLSDLPEEVREARLEVMLRDAAGRQPALARAGQLSLTEVIVAPHRHVLLLNLPALRADAVGLKNLMKELGDCYAACLRNEEAPEIPFQYADLSEWQNEALEAEGAEAGRDYWRTQKRGTSALSLPFERDAAEPVEFKPELSLSFLIDRETIEKLESVAALHDSSLSSALLGAFFVLVSRLSSSSEPCLGVSFEGRNYDELSSALGLFARFLPVQSRVTGELAFSQLLAHLDSSLSDAGRWQELFTTDDESRPAADAPQAGGQTFLPFCYEFADEATPSINVTPSLRFSLRQSAAYITRFKLLLRCLRRSEDGAVIAEWHYDASRYSRAEVARVAEGWKAAVRSICQREGALRLDEVEIVGDAERAELLQEFQGTAQEWSGARCVHEIIAEQARLTPQAIALRGPDESLTYAELDERGNRLARHLRERGVKAEQRVGLLLERSVGMVVGLLGILKAGGAYVPLERSLPLERLSRMAADAGLRVIVSVEELREVAEALARYGQSASSEDEAKSADERINSGIEHVVYLDGDEIRKQSGEGIEATAGEENTAYVLYTSGSTGSPKGVCVEHRQLTNYLYAILRQLNLPAGAGFALVSTFAADLGNTAIFPALCTGGTLHVLSHEQTSDPAALASYFGEHPIDCMKIVPSHLSALMTHSRPEQVLPRQCLVLGGEASSWELIERIQGIAPDCRILNHYGPTETTIGVLVYRVGTRRAARHSRTIPLGRPIANTQVYVLDDLLRAVPKGLPGELYIGGDNVTRGYLKNPETTAARFIPNPFSKEPGARLYRTGDRARHLPDGNIEFLGRTDDQVKIKGFRIEPGEIEAVLREHEAVAQAKVLARESDNGSRQLIAYLVPASDCAATVRRRLRLEREGSLDARRCYELPNGMLVASQNRNETDFMYREIFEQQIYLQHGITLDDGDCVFDVGANIGMFSLFVERVCKNAKVYAFEPMPPLFELLRANTALYGMDAKLFRCGVAAEATQAEFTFYPHLTLMSGRFADSSQDREVVKFFELNRRGPEESSQLDDKLLGEVLMERLTGESFVCQMKRISDVIRENRVERIDLLKIDVQKSELEVLLGIDEDDWPRIKQIVLEVHDIGDRLRQITALLESRGFQVTTGQEAVLKETGLYDLYCVRPGQVGKLSSESDSERATRKLSGWNSPEALVEDVRAHLKERLADHMMPAAFVLLENMPLTANGKIDRQALPAPRQEKADEGKQFVPPGNETEEILAGVWRQVLGVREVGIHDNFFELGGDSILSIQIVARANQAGLKLSPKQLFRHQTIAELAANITLDADESGPLAEDGQELLTGAVPLTPIQRHFFARPLINPHHFNQSLLLTVRRRISRDILQRVMAAVVAHHDALRMRFERTTQDWEQRYGGAESVGEVEVREADVSHLDEAARAAQIEAVCDAMQRSLRLEGGGLLRVVLFETGAEQRLLLLAHHLVVDGVSWRVLVEDVINGYEQAERGQEIKLGRKTTSYRKWAERLREYAQGEKAKEEQRYWREIEKAAGGKLPIDYQAGENTVESARTVSVSLDGEETRALLQEVPEAYQTQINDALLMALVEAIGKWSGQRQVLVEMEGHGREELWDDIDLSRTLGWFTTLFPVAFELKPGARKGELLKSVKEQLRRVPNRGLGYGLLRYLCEEAKIAEALAALPRAEVRFNYLGQLDHVLPSNSLLSLSREATGADRDRREQRPYLIDVAGAVSGGRLQLNVSYSENIHQRAGIEALGHNLLESLRGIISHCQAMEVSDYSPSDFPLAKVSQQQLDRIMSRAGASNRSSDD